MDTDPYAVTLSTEDGKVLADTGFGEDKAQYDGSWTGIIKISDTANYHLPETVTVTMHSVADDTDTVLTAGTDYTYTINTSDNKSTGEIALAEGKKVTGPITVKAVAETHVYDYTVDETGSTDTCAILQQDCDCGHHATATLTAPEGAAANALVYDGVKTHLAAVATSTGNVGEDLNTWFGSAPAITYKKVKDAETKETVENAKNAGTYEASISMTGVDESATATVTYSVNKAEPLAAYFTYNTPTEDYLVYKANKKTVTVAPGMHNELAVVGMGAITVKYYNDGADTVLGEAPINVGSYDVKIDVAEGDNYLSGNDLSADWGFAITPYAGPYIAAEIPDQNHTSAAITPDDLVKISVSFLENSPLVKDRDYTLTYENNVNIGENTAEAKVQFIGNFAGTLTKNFSIVAVALPEETGNEGVFEDYSDTSTKWPAPAEQSDGVTFTPEEGWKVSTEPNGPFNTSVSFNEEGKAVEKTVYVKNEETGVIYETKVAYNLDKTQPEIPADEVAVDNVGVTNQDKPVTFDATDSISGVEIGNIVVTRGTGEEQKTFEVTALEGGGYSFNADQNGEYTITVTDTAGNTTSHKVTVENIDKTLPTVDTLVPTAEPTGANGWYKEDVTIPVTAADEGGSNVKEQLYSLDGGQTWLEVMEGKFTITEDGSYPNVLVKIVDHAGNETLSAPIEITIDSEKPTITGEQINPAIGWMSGNATIRFTADDATSGVDTVVVTYDDGAAGKDVKCDYDADTNEATFKAAQNGDYTITVTDKAGNAETKTVKYHDHIYVGYSRDGAGHWQQCTDKNCPDPAKGKVDAAPHIYSSNTATTCSVCAYKRTLPAAGQVSATLNVRTPDDIAQEDVKAVLKDTSGNTYELKPGTPVSAPEGTYQLVITATDEDGNTVTQTTVTTLTAGIPAVTVPADLGSGNKTTVVDTDDAGAYVNAQVGGLENVPAAEAADKEVEITLTVTEEADMSHVDAEQMAIKDEVQGDLTAEKKAILSFVDITLTKEVEGEGVSDIGASNNVLLTIVLPFDPAGKSDLRVLRHHGSIVEEIFRSANVNGEYYEMGTDAVIVHAKKFSTYALSYTLDDPDAHSHAYGSWQANRSSHWMVCVDPNCDDAAKGEVREAHTLVNRTCTVCGYYKTASGGYIPAKPAEPEKPDTPDTPDTPDKPTSDVEIRLLKYDLVARSKMSRAKGKNAVKVWWYDANGLDLDYLDGFHVYRSMKRYSGYGKKPFFKTTRDMYFNTLIEKGKKYYYYVLGYKKVGDEVYFTKKSRKAWRIVR